MAINRLKNRLFDEIPGLLHNHILDIRKKSNKFQTFFDQHEQVMESILNKVVRGIMESIFMTDEEYQIFLGKLQLDNEQSGRSFLLQYPELSPTDVLELNQNLYFHLMKTCTRILELENDPAIYKPKIIERLYLTFSTSDHSFLQGFLQFKDKQVSGLHYQKISMLGQMAAGMAHEIRNPLTSIKGFISLILEQINQGQLNHEDLKYYLLVCSEQMNSLESIVSSFLTLAREKEGQASAERYTLQPVMERLNILAQFYALEKSVSYSHQLPSEEVILWGSPSVLEQICLNLIRNAMDAVTEGGRGQVHLEAILKQEEKVIDLVLTDNGQGMSPDVLAKIWSPFFTTKETGTGLGLAISRQLTEEMGGTIRIHSVEGEGTQVILSLPILSEEGGL